RIPDLCLRCVHLDDRRDRDGLFHLELRLRVLWDYLRRSDLVQVELWWLALVRLQLALIATATATTGLIGAWGQCDRARIDQFHDRLFDLRGVIHEILRRRHDENHHQDV